jgi:hypothetical protein
MALLLAEITPTERTVLMRTVKDHPSSIEKIIALLGNLTQSKRQAEVAPGIVMDLPRARALVE